jgi:WD40 repeat protein
MLGHPDVNPNRIGRNGTYPTWVTAVAFSPDGKRVLTASRQYLSPMEWTPSRVALWDRASGKQVAHWEPARAGENRGRALPLDGTALPAAAIAFSPRGDRIVATGDFGQVWILDAQSLAAARQWTAHDSTVFAVAVDRDGRRLATAGQDQTIRIWDLGTGARLAVLPGHSGAVYDLAFSPDGRRLASAAADGTVKIWNWAAFLPQAEPASLKQSESGLPSLLPRVVKGD